MSPRTLVIVFLLAVQLTVTCALALRERPVPASRFALTMVPIPVATPLPPPAPPAPLPPPPPPSARPSCPPIRTDAAPLPANHPLPRGVNRVTASLTNAGWIAAWDEKHVLVSTDAGLSFRQVLDGPGAIRDVAFDCFGRPIVLRGNQVGVRDGTHERWRVIPGVTSEVDAPGVLIGGGPDIVAIGVESMDTWNARVAISSDLGTTWWFRELHDYWETSLASGRQDADGTIQLALITADCDSDPTYWLRVHPDGTVETEDVGNMGRVALYGDTIVGGYSELRWKRFGEASWHDVTGISGVRQLASGPLLRATTDSAIYTLDRGHATPLRPWRFGAATVDLAGRLWGIDESSDGEDAWLVAVPGSRAPIPPPDPQNE